MTRLSLSSTAFAVVLLALMVSSAVRPVAAGQAESIASDPTLRAVGINPLYSLGIPAFNPSLKTRQVNDLWSDRIQRPGSNNEGTNPLYRRSGGERVTVSAGSRTLTTVKRPLFESGITDPTLKNAAVNPLY